MTITDRRFIRPGIERITTDRHGRWYQWDGDRYWSVTTIIQRGVSNWPITAWSKKHIARYAVDNHDTIGQMLREGLTDEAFLLLRNSPDVYRDERADIGTTLHALTEQMDRGTLDTIPPNHAADLDAYALATEPLKVVATEMFVVNDHLKAAGTLDRLVRLPDGRLVVADLKTGATEPSYPHGVTTQCAIYAHSWRYDIEKQQRLAYLPENEVSTEVGLLIHLPAGKAKCDLYLLDLTVGWQLAKTATAVRAVYKSKPIQKYTH